MSEFISATEKDFALENQNLSENQEKTLVSTKASLLEMEKSSQFYDEIEEEQLEISKNILF
jgi:hypothetical protein